MPWFRLEDSFHANPKVKHAGNPAVGLWVRCGTWSSAYLTDGHIPFGVARDFGSRREMMPSHGPPVGAGRRRVRDRRLARVPALGDRDQGAPQT